MKIAPLHAALSGSELFRHSVIDYGFLEKPYAGQTYQDLGMPDPDLELQAPRVNGNGNPSIDAMETEMRDAVDKLRPDHLLIYGDVDSSVAAARAAVALDVPFTHVEAGLRSFDQQDHEELNRIEIDRLANSHITHSSRAIGNLLDEGYDRQWMLQTGNPLIASLRRAVDRLERQPPLGVTGVEPGRYCIATLHRREMLTDEERLGNVIKALHKIASILPVVLIGYRSTSRHLERIAPTFNGRLRTIRTLPYLDYVNLLRNARLVVTDSSGLQDETSALGVPCVTCRVTTHRHDTVEIGTNCVAGYETHSIVNRALEALEAPYPAATGVPDAWGDLDGQDLADFLAMRLGTAERGGAQRVCGRD